MTAPPPTAGRPFKLWWLAAILTATWAGLALARVVPRDGPPPATKGLPLARRVVADLRRAYPEPFQGWQPFDADPPARGGDVGATTGLEGLVALDRSPPEVRAALKAMYAAWARGAEEGIRLWAQRSPEPLDADLVAAVEKALQLR